MIFTDQNKLTQKRNNFVSKQDGGKDRSQTRPLLIDRAGGEKR